jgi:hypothetical protein
MKEKRNTYSFDGESNSKEPLGRLMHSIKAHSNDAKRFKTTLKNYLIQHAFYSLDEYYQFQ